MKKTSRIISVFLIVVMLAGIAAIAPVTADAAVPAWKTAYVNYLKSHKVSDNGGGYGLVDADKNGIPELLCFWGTGTMGTGSISTFNNNKMQTIYLSDFNGGIDLFNNKYLVDIGSRDRYIVNVYGVN